MRLVTPLLQRMPPALRHAVIRRSFTISERSIRSLRVHVASTPEEHEQAARLLHRVYERRGIAEQHLSGLRVLPQHLAPSTITFVACDQARPGAPVIGTVSLVRDSPLGLPMDAIYRDELQPLRDQGRQLAECGALCLDRGYRGTGVMYLLCRIMSDHAIATRCDDVVITVHPAAADYYHANMVFEPLGPVRSYPGLRSTALALALRLDLGTFLEVCARRFGSRALDDANPLWLWFGRRNPQIAPFDRSEAGLGRHLQVRRRAARHLATLRPDVLHTLEPQGAAYLASVVPELSGLLGPHAPSRG